MRVRTIVDTSATVGLEAAWLGARVASYPFGFGRDRVRGTRDVHRPDDLKPHQRGLIGSAETPVLLVHGLIDNRSVFSVLRRSLRRKGFRHVATMNYPVLTTDVRAAARLLAVRVEQLCEETGADQVHLVGHSLGGIIARWYVQQMGGDARVGTVVTLGSPHAGTALAKVLPMAVLRQLLPGSDVLTALAAPAPGCRTRVISMWSDTDELMVPRSTAQLQHPDLDVRNVRLGGVGHVSMPIHPQVVTEITRALAVPAPRPAPVAERVDNVIAFAR